MDGRKTDQSSVKFVFRQFELFMSLKNLRFKLTEVINNPPIPLFSSSRRPVEDAPIDLREIDKVLSELAGMVGRWHLFKKFLSEALKVLKNNCLAS